MSGERRLKVVDEVGLFPWEEVALGLAPEMAIGRGRGVDRLVEAKRGADAARGEATANVERADGRFQPVVGDRAGAVRVDIER